MWLDVKLFGEEGQYLSWISFGHTMPMDESLAIDLGPLHLSRYDLVSPAGAVTPLGLPQSAASNSPAVASGFGVRALGDIGLRYLSPGKKVEPGTYQVVGAVALAQNVRYRDPQGREHFARDTPVAAIKDMGTLIESLYWTTDMKAVYSVDDWTAPKAVGSLMEIVPLTDLSKLRAGQKARFQVLLDGKPLQLKQGATDGLTASSATLHGDTAIHMTLVDGVAEMVAPAAGHWRIDASAQRGVKELKRLASLPDQMSVIMLSASLTFDVAM